MHLLLALVEANLELQEEGYALICELVMLNFSRVGQRVKLENPVLLESKVFPGERVQKVKEEKKEKLANLVKLGLQVLEGPLATMDPRAILSPSTGYKTGNCYKPSDLLFIPSLFSYCRVLLASLVTPALVVNLDH
eukprot:g41231.t1